MDLYRESDDLRGNLEFGCVLPKATRNGVDPKLGWEVSRKKSGSDGKDEEEEDISKDVRNDVKAKEIKATYSRDVGQIMQEFRNNINLEDFTYTCRYYRGYF